MKRAEKKKEDDPEKERGPVRKYLWKMQVIAKLFFVVSFYSH